MTTKYEGIIASNGIAIGTVYLFNREEVVIDDSKIEEGMVDDEKNRIKDAIDNYIDQLNDTNGANEAQINIANAHKELLQDPYFSDTINAKYLMSSKTQNLL